MRAPRTTDTNRGQKREVGKMAAIDKVKVVVVGDSGKMTMNMTVDTLHILLKLQTKHYQNSAKPYVNRIWLPRQQE